MTDDFPEWSDDFQMAALEYNGHSSDEDNISLARLSEIIRRARNELDDVYMSDGDGSYHPDKSEINTSDSNSPFTVDKERNLSNQTNVSCKSSMCVKQKQRKGATRRKIKTCRKLDFLSKGKQIFQRKCTKVPMLSNKISATNSKTSKQKQQTVKAKISKYHHKRLDNLLASNGFERKRVAKNGDCLFTSVAMCLHDSGITAFDIRQQVGNHMQENEAEYSCFLVCDSHGDKTEQFQREVTKIKTRGYWDSNLADCLPLALANSMNCTLRVFSSRLNNPLYEVMPSLQPGIAPKSEIMLALTATPDNEHYDAVVKKAVTQTDPSTSLQISSQQINEEHMSIETTNNTELRSVSPPVTPQKDAEYSTPHKKNSTRKKQCHPNLWKASMRKNNRNKGKEYVSKRGNVVAPPHLKPINCLKCKLKCSEKINDNIRMEIFNSYWQLGDYIRQRDFICEPVSKRHPSKSIGYKTVTYCYYLTVNEERVRVCRNSFLKTLDIGKRTVHYTLNRKEQGSFNSYDHRGKHEPTNKLPDESVKYIHEHVKSFPTMESHYTRKDSKRLYLEQELTISKMWRMYIDKCKKQSRQPVKEKKYREIFCQYYNYSFFKPKKDQCGACTAYALRQKEGLLDENMKQSNANHHEIKLRARQEKQNDKDKAKQNRAIYAATFDLQAVLSTPFTRVGELYYKRKLSCYNLSFYSLGDKSGTCYVWDETQGHMGACEIGTCILMHTKSITTGCSPVAHVTYICDSCGGQNRNQFVAAALLFAITNSTSKSLKTIDQKFFERGHSQMESDSIHSTMESAKQKTSVYVPSQWHTVISMARRNNPYLGIPVKYKDIVALKTFTRTHCPNMKRTTTGARVNWLKIKWIMVKKDAPRSLFVSYSFETADQLEINVQDKIKTRRRMPNWPLSLGNCYSAKLPISSAKKTDLLSLCESGFIPDDCQDYYRLLPSSGTVKDKIPSPDMEDSN